MHKLEVKLTEMLQAVLRQETGRSPQSRFVHRLHCVAMVGTGRSCYEVAKVFADDPRTVERWVREFQRHGIDGLREKPHSGRRAALSDAQIRQLQTVVADDPRQLGYAADAWNGKLMRAEILRRFGVTLSGRHCQRLLRIVRQSRQRAGASRSQD